MHKFESLSSSQENELAQLNSNFSVQSENLIPIQNYSRNIQQMQLDTYRLDLEIIINELRFITQKLRDDEQESLVSLEWKFAARVIDRFCLIVFGLFNLIATFAILFSAPNLAASFMP